MILKKQSLHENLNQGQGFTFKFLSLHDWGIF